MGFMSEVVGLTLTLSIGRVTVESAGSPASYMSSVQWHQPL